MGSRIQSANRSERPNEDELDIPLRCIICPEKENFSDVSHLLTHVSSKSHLARKFEVELRAKTGHLPSALKLDQFKRWNNENGIDALLSERLASKERRRSRTRGGGTGSRSRRQPSRHPPAIKSEPLDEVSGGGTGAPPLHHWDTAPSTANNTHLRSYDSPIFQTPTNRRSNRRGQSMLGLEDFDDVIGKHERDRSEVTDESFLDDTPGLDIGDDDDESSKLKGTKYPGIGVFDAATPEQKRKRNQRKDDTVIQQMQLTSERIEAMETIWNKLGDPQRSRDIYATPSIEGSPVLKHAELEAPKKKRKPRKEAAPRASSGGRRAKTTARVTTRARRSVKTVRQSRMATLDDSDDQDDEVWDTEQNPKDTCRDLFRDDARPRRAADRMESPYDDNRIPLSHRNALQPRDSNVLMMPATQGPKQVMHPFIGHSGHMPEPRSSYGHQQSDYSSGYILPSQHAQHADNPLCIQSRGSATPFPHYHPSPIYDGGERSTQTTSFAPINGRLSYPSIHLGGSGSAHGLPHSHDPSDYQI